VIQSSDENPAKVETVLLTMRTGGGPGGASSNSEVVSTDIPATAGRRAWAHMQKFDKPDPNSETDLNAQAAAEASFGGDANAAPAPAEPAAAAGAAQGASPGSAPDDASAATAANAPPPPPALGISPSTDAKSAVQDRINSMQQMFDQRRQMMQKQNAAPGQNTGPSN
jgi:hypothetical protein